MKKTSYSIKKESFEELCSIMCSSEEIAGFFHVTQATLNKWCKETYGGRTFNECFSEFSSGGKISLRRTQFELSKNNASMAIFLGKNYLGQKDVLESNVNEKVEITNDMPKVD